MSGGAVPAPAPHLTRRQIREAERAAEAARLAQVEDAVRAPFAERATAQESPATDAPVTEAVVERAPVAETPQVTPATAAPALAADLEDAEVLPYRAAQPLPARRDLRTRHTGRRPEARASRLRAASVRTSPAVRHWAPRAAVLGALGAMTIVAPLTGLAGPDGVSPAQAKVSVQPSILALLDTQAAEAALESTPESLLADPGAASRATILQASRAGARDTLTCAADGANGARAAVAPEQQDQIVRPLEAGVYRISSQYGYRVSPFTGYSKHLGTDFSAPLGTSIHAVADGTVEYVGVGKDGRSSMLVILRHEIEGETVYSWYIHMYPSGIDVEEGQEVSAGDVIAQVGSNGRSTGPHLHLEIHLDADGTTTDPLSWLEEHGAIDVAALC